MRRLGAAGPAKRPKRLGDALRQVRAETAPATLLAAVQEAWPSAAGPQVAAEAQPVSERAGVITVACRSAVWAQELDFLQGELVEKLNAALDEGQAVAGLRFTADAARGDVG